MRFLLLLVLLAGCTPEMNEQIRRGRPSASDYIEKDYRKVKVIFYQPFQTGKVGNRSWWQNEYSTVEDDRNIRYKIPGKAGEVGDEFRMDVSLLEEVK